MGTNDKPVDNIDQAELPEDPNSPPESGLAQSPAAPVVGVSPELLDEEGLRTISACLSDLTFLGINFAIEGPEPEESESNFRLARCESHWPEEGLADPVILFRKKAWGERS